MMILTTALAAAACSGGSKGGSTSLPSIAGVSPTPAATSGAPTTPTAEPSTAASSPASASPSATTTASATVSASASSSSSAAAGGGCLSSQLSLSLGQSQGAAGSQISPLIFTNTGATSCTLSGYPGVSFVTGDTGTQVGAAAVRNGATGSGANLVPKQTAQALVKVANAEDYPTATCKPVTVRGLRVYPPGQQAALFVALPDGTTACSGSSVSSQLSVQSVTATS